MNQTTTETELAQLISTQVEITDNAIEKIAAKSYIKTIGLWSLIPTLIALIGLRFTGGFSWLWYILIGWALINVVAFIFLKKVQLPKLEKVKVELKEQIAQL